MVRITVCDGPWCGMRSADLVQVFEAELRRMKLDKQVDVTTSPCMGACKHGPCVRIGGVKYFRVEEALIPELIRKHVLPLLTA